MRGGCNHCLGLVPRHRAGALLAVCNRVRMVYITNQDIFTLEQAAYVYDQIGDYSVASQLRRAANWARPFVGMHFPLACWR